MENLLILFISTFKIAPSSEARIIHSSDIMALSESHNLEEHEAIRQAAGKYGIDIVIHHTGNLLMQNSFLIIHATNWQSCLEMYAEWVYSVPQLQRNRPRDVFDSYSTAYSYACSKEDMQGVADPKTFYSNFIFKLEEDFTKLQDSDSKTLYQVFPKKVFISVLKFLYL